MKDKNISSPTNGSIKGAIGEGMQNLIGKARKALAPTAGKLEDDEAAPVDPFEFLMSQHREVESLFEELERVGTGSVRFRKDIFMELARKLEAHAQTEELVLYPAGREADEKKTFEAYEEHKLCRVVIEDLAKGGRDDTLRFDAHVKVLKEVVQHHVKEEENEYFKTLRAQMSEEEIQQLGRTLPKEFARIEKLVMRQPVGARRPLNADAPREQDAQERPRRRTARTGAAATKSGAGTARKGTRTAVDGRKAGAAKAAATRADRSERGVKASKATKSTKSKTRSTVQGAASKARSVGRPAGASKKAGAGKATAGARKAPVRAATRAVATRRANASRGTHA